MIVQVKITKKNDTKPEEFLFMSDTVMSAVNYVVPKVSSIYDITEIEARKLEICDITKEKEREDELDLLIKYTIGLEDKDIWKK